MEEAPSPVLTPDVRKQMGDAAVSAAKSIGYKGVGTIEFLWEEKGFYFMEMNTRIQVEHPVTEMVTGTDLIQEQIKVAKAKIVVNAANKHGLYIFFMVRIIISLLDIP